MRRILFTMQLVFSGAVFLGLNAIAARNSFTIDLAGKWQCALDREDKGVEEGWFLKDLPLSVQLPGSLTENGIGDDVTVETHWTGSIADRSWYTDPKYAPYRKPGHVKVPFWLTPVKYYVGAAWYSRDVEIPQSWEGKRIILFLERCHWESRLWIDGRDQGTSNSLACPHVYDLSGVLKPGKHRIALRIDNRLKIDVGQNAHSVTDHTQTNWNGIVGALKLIATDPVWLQDVQVYPRINERAALVKVLIGNKTGSEVKGTLALRAEGFEELRKSVNVNAAEETEVEVFYKLGEKAQLWDEFDPVCYDLSVSFEGGSFYNERTVRFGLRSFKAEGTRFCINGRPTFLRGTLECCIFPLTGCPPMDVEAWLRVLGRAKSFGMNHFRFHSWCPPEAAFEAADRLGIYFHIECSAWARIGDGKPIDRFIYLEGDRILKWYGNHPSFCMLAYGNEPGGPNQRRYLGKLVTYWKKKDPRRVYTGAAGWPIIPENEYHVTPAPRIFHWGEGLRCRLNRLPPETQTDYRQFVSRFSVPVVGHEIGQWCVYPNFKEIPKYKGVLRAGNFEIFRDSLRKNHMLDLAGKFLMASGKLQLLCYKEEVEAALRTPGFAGFQMLQLHDFPGQGTALVGVVDPFWDPKPYVSAEIFRRFNAPTVPLARLPKFAWTTGETLTAQVEVAHFGKAPLRKAQFRWSFAAEEGAIAAQGVFPAKDIPIGNCIELGALRFALSGIVAPKKLKLKVWLPGTECSNSWSVWVYPAGPVPKVPASIHVCSYLDDQAVAALKGGGKVLLLPAPRTVKGDQSGRVPPGFTPIFWNTAWTRGMPPHTLGILCDPGHPLFRLFPTEYHSNWQWWEIIHGSQIMILQDLPHTLRPLVQVIDDWFTNRKLGLVFEAGVAGGKLLVCGADLRKDLEKRPAAAQFLRSIIAYMLSADFKPSLRLSIAQVRSLQREPGLLAAAKVIERDSEAKGYEAEKILDGDPTTFWHTPWAGKAPPYPHYVVIDLGGVFRLRGFIYVPRQDMRNGRVRGYELWVSADGKRWKGPVASGNFKRGRRSTTVIFRRITAPVRYVRFVAKSPQVDGQPFASVAELEFLPVER